jgi:integrase/recombinase XerD
MAGGSVMMHAVEAYLRLRRRAGFGMETAEFVLRSFARFAAKRKQTLIRTQTALDWAALGPSVAQRDARLKAICRFARHIRAEDRRHELPPAKYFGYRKKRRAPHIYSLIEIDSLIEAALRLRSKGGLALRAQTYATLVALLASTGLRVSEALGLHHTDVTADGLLIRETKFRKSRLVPLHDTAKVGLDHYLAKRGQAGSDDDHVFIGDHGRALPYHAVHSTFKTLLRKANLWPAQGCPRPRLHDLRHTFAVRALQASPSGRTRVNQHMVALSTYLGHVNIYATFWYLEAAADLMRDIADVGEAFMKKGAQS